MAGGSERCRSLKEALFEALAAALSNEHGVRAAGEEQMKTLEVTEGDFSKLPRRCDAPVLGSCRLTIQIQIQVVRACV